MAPHHENPGEATLPDAAGRAAAPGPPTEQLPHEPMTVDFATMPSASDVTPRPESFGDYEIIDEIARGGMGVVFRARQISLNRIVALKMILKGELATPADVQRFRAEAEAAARLDHPNIVPIYEVGEHAGRPYYTMKFIPGGSLAGDTPGASDRMTIRQEATRLSTIARAVHYAHQRGLLHRDLKPGNILIGQKLADSSLRVNTLVGSPESESRDSAAVFVTDFGLAKRVEGDAAISHTNAVVGTPGYMAPEQAKADVTLTTAVDIWSLGAILHERLTGKPPFRGETPLATLKLLVESDPARPRSVNPHIDRDLETIVLKCLEKDPSRRYASADALANDLDRWSRGEPILARPASGIERAWRWVKRRPARAALALAPIVGLIAWSVQATRVANSESKAREEQAKFAEQLQSAHNETQDALARAKSALALNRLHLAHQYYQAHDVAEARRLLAGVPESARAWEWNFLQRQVHPEERFVPLAGPVAALSASKDASRTLTVHHHGASVATVWDTLTWKPVREVTLSKTGDPRMTAVLAPDGRTFAAGGADGSVRLFDATTGKELKVLGTLSSELAGFQFPADRTRPRGPGQPPRAPGSDHAAGIAGLFFDPAGKFVAARTVSQLIVWNVEDGKEVLKTAIAYTAETRQPGFRADGKLFAICSYATDTQLLLRNVLTMNLASYIEFFDTTTSKRTSRVQLTAGVVLRSAAWADKQIVYTAAEPMSFQVRLYSVTPENPVTRSVPVGDIGSALSVSPDGKHAAMATPGLPAVVSELDLGQARLPRTVAAAPARINSLAWLGNSGLLAVGCDDGLHVWRPDRIHESYAVTPKSTGRVAAARFAPGGKAIVWSGAQSSGGSLQYQDLTTGEPAPGRVFHTPRTAAEFDIHPDGQRVASVFGWSALVWNPRTTEPGVPLLGDNSQSLAAVAWDPAGKRLALAVDHPDLKSRKENWLDPARVNGPPSTLEVWDADTKKRLTTMTGHPGVIELIDWSPDGATVFAVGAGAVSAWDAATGQSRWITRHSFGGPCSQLAVSPTGGELACACAGMAYLIDAGSGVIRHTLPGPDLFAIAYSADGTRLATGGSSIKLWDPASGLELLNLRIPQGPGPRGDRFPLAVTFAGNALLAAMTDASVLRWDGRPPGQ
ncbi:MAG: protein kinase [Gemmataceae bacterium]|nr:protein kinase [Gemmataceae bacterium]